MSRRVAAGLAIVAALVPMPVLAATPDEAVRDWFEGGRAVCPVPPSAPPAAPGALLRSVPSVARVEIAPAPDRDLATLRWTDVRVLPDPEEIRFDVREGTVGLTVRARSSTEAYFLDVQLLSSTGTLIGCATCPGEPPAVGEARIGRGTVQVPSTDRPGWELEPGRYAFRILAIPDSSGTSAPEGDVTADVVATFRTERAVQLEWSLDLNFVYLPGCSLSVDIARTSPEFAALVDRITTWMAPTGIRIGRLTHVDLDRPEFSVIATWDEAARMFRTSRDVGVRRALNVYCVEGFEAPLNPVVGLSGGIPGPVHMGTRDSGIAIRTPPLFTCQDCLDAFGSLFAHEIGHYLGFYHTTEADLEEEDPLSDTPRCWKPDLRNCPDWYHVMFPVIHPANTVWSPSQVTIARTHPLVRAVPVLGAASRERATGLATISPNPFRESTRIRLAPGAGGGGPVTATVYDVLGRRVRALAASAGVLSWDGRDEGGRVLPGGIYFARVETSRSTRNLRLVKLR